MSTTAMRIREHSRGRTGGFDTVLEQLLLADGRLGISQEHVQWRFIVGRGKATGMRVRLASLDQALRFILILNVYIS